VMSDLRECVTGDTLVCLTDGRRIPIRELVGTTPEVWAVDERQKLVAAASDKVWSVGTRQVFRVTLAGGRSICATTHHRMFCEDGWKTVAELAAGQRLATFGGPQEPADLASSDLFWDRIARIELAGEAEVFDLTVPGPACWLADGMVTHNSGAIEQDADMILFIYREEVYDKNTPRKGEADIDLAKHRNGEPGHFQLTFQGQYTRFQNFISEAYKEGVLR